MLLVIDTTTRKAWWWDLDDGQPSTVQPILQKFYDDVDPPRIQWSDNAGCFRNVIASVTKTLLRMDTLFIPAKHPQSNGMVECLNKIVALMSSSRKGLSAALRSWNVHAHSVTKIAPETLWRLLRTPTSKWSHLAVQKTLGLESATKANPTMEDLDFYYDRLQAWERDADMKKTMEDFTDRKDEIGKLVFSQSARADLARKIDWSRNQRNARDGVFLTNDLVIEK